MVRSFTILSMCRQIHRTASIRFLAAAGHADFPFHVCTPYVGLSAPGKKIVLVGLNPTGALGRKLLDAYDPVTGLREGAYDRYVKREAGGKPSLARGRFTRCFAEVARALREPVGVIVTNVHWNASSRWNTLPEALRFPAPLDRFLSMVKGECVVVVHGKATGEHYRALRERAPSLPDAVYCPHFSPLGKGDLPAIAAEIAGMADPFKLNILEDLLAEHHYDSKRPCRRDESFPRRRASG